jgi:hypothetical protein
MLAMKKMDIFFYSSFSPFMTNFRDTQCSTTAVH